MLQGDHGKQRKEIDKLVSWLVADVKPDVLNLTNAILAGMVPRLKQKLPGVPLLCSLQGDDIYTESLPEPYKSRSLALIREHSRLIDGFVATSAYYADFMAGYFDVPRDKIHVILPGINLHGHGERPTRQGKPFTVGYFARICPEKGFHQIIDAFIHLRKLPGTEAVKLHASGYLGENNRVFFNDQRKRLDAAGLLSDFVHRECPTHSDKVRFLHELDVLSVPTTYREPKGLYVLEALANGVPVVQPRHGSFPELVEATGGGVLVEPGNAAELAVALKRLRDDRGHAEELGQRGRAAVHERFHAARMAEETAALYRRYVERPSGVPV
jgi:glycosyltransferase involved in cell wall biosynthesis